MNIVKFRKKLDRYLKGKSNETESAIVEAWYKSYQNAEAAEISAYDKAIIKNAIRKKLNKAKATPIIQFGRPNYRIAAGLLIMLGVAIFLIRKQPTVKDTYTTLQTNAGEIKQIVLPDSSLMWVNSLTTVRIPATFNGSIRNILLDNGEVFLNVKHNAAKPFRVSTHSLQVQVLGTSFNVKAYASIKHTNVSVSTGKVAVSSAGKRLSLLMPGQELVFNEDTKAFRQNKIDISASQGWKDGETYLTQASFSELSLVVKNMFGLQLKAANKTVEQYQFTLRLKRNMPADDALKIISLIHNTHYRREGMK